MKRNYTLKTALLLIVITLCFSNLTAQENVRILRLDPATNSVTLKNFGDATATVSGYWFCNRPSYAGLSGMTAVTTLAPNEELNVASSVNFPVASGEFALYNSNSFSDSAAILDYLQWGTGNSGSSRESVAVAAGLWVADTFITDAPPFQYNGDGTQNGVTNWSTLGVEDFTVQSNLNIYPNPSNSILNIELQNLNGSVQVFNMLGKQIFSKSITSDVVSQIDVTEWNNGLYLVKITTENTVETKRFIKN